MNFADSDDNPKVYNMLHNYISTNAGKPLYIYVTIISSFSSSRARLISKANLLPVLIGLLQSELP